MPGDNPNIVPMEGLPLNCPSCGATRDLTEYVWGIVCGAMGEWSAWSCRRRLLEEAVS